MHPVLLMPDYHKTGARVKKIRHYRAKTGFFTMRPLATGLRPRLLLQKKKFSIN